MPDSSSYKTEQEVFWAGDFGNEYIGRNKAPELIAANLSLFSDILNHANGIGAIIEFGANVGLNLQALHQLLPKAKLAAIEINAQAANELRSLGYVDVRHQSILDYTPQDTHDLSFIKTVLIHINPDHLATVYDAIYTSSRKYICVVEYYNPTPVTVTYRGHTERLFKRDFAGEIMDRYSDLRLVAYGFKYWRDPSFNHSDVTWFLMEKSAAMK
jgi:spore coat polysaccharide biosynthesis protein SpsF